MAVIEARIAPFIRKVFTITGTQYYYSGSGQPHGGLDISTGFNDDLYSMVNGKVLSVVHNHSSYGNYIIIQDTTTGDSFLYAHMKTIEVVQNQQISMGQLVGQEGMTGEATGIHLHLELQYHNVGESWTWNVPYEDRPNVAEYLGLTNTQGLQAIYYGTPVPPTPTVRQKHRFPWYLVIARKKRRGEL